MVPALSIDELRGHLGSELGISEWTCLSQETIQAFADATGDHQFIHVDPERARHTPFGGTIAHGMLLLSLLPALASQCVPPLRGRRMAINFGFDRVRFLSAVPSGSPVRGRFVLYAVTERSSGILLEYDVTLEARTNARPALVARWMTLAVMETE